ncbi:heme oxygenase [Lysinibacillus capsici]|uniref:heme oxygenase n=1 Tax=Lysinibacillus capsici TaxID=2115968 RepID=UPI00248184CB|nr:heme oxygenase [Lysinibacillus capsici]
MIIVTNRIQVKPGFAARMAPNFTKPGPLQQFEGFHKVEVLISTDDPTYDEMSVNMYWESKEHFQAWRNSDAFAAAHQRPNSGSEREKADSPIIGSKIVVAELASSIEALN